MGCIYSILNKSNGKIYIGQTIRTPNERKSEHFSRLRNQNHINPHLQNSWNKYGEDTFEFNVLENCPNEELGVNEDWWVTYFDSTNRTNGYNLQSGGYSNYTVSDETRIKQSEALKGCVRSEEFCRKISDARKGMKFSEKHKENISKAISLSLNNTGYYRVHIDKDSRYAQGFRYVYKWVVDGKNKKITSTSLDNLKEKVLSHGLEWFKIDE